MFSLQLSLAAIVATASAASLDFETDATLHDYMSYSSGVADSNPPWCEVSYASLDLSSVTAYGSVTKDSCGDCLEVCGTTGCKHLLVIDQCSRGAGGQLDISTGAGQQICGATTGHCAVTAKTVDASFCSHIWDGKMFFPYTPLYGGFSKLKQILDGEGGAAAGSSAPASSSIQTSTPLPTSTIAPTSLPPVQTFSPEPAPVESSSSTPVPVFTPPTSSSTPLQIPTTRAVMSSSSAYTPPAVTPPFPMSNSTASAASVPSASPVSIQATGGYCPRPAVTKTITPTTTLFVTVSGTPTPVAVANVPAGEQPEQEQEQEPASAPTNEEGNQAEPGQEQQPSQQQQQQQPGEQQQPQPSSLQTSTPELTTTNIVHATQTLQVFTTLTTRVVAVNSVLPTAPTAPSAGIPLSTGSPGQGWNSTAPPTYGGGGAGTGSGFERRAAEHMHGHVNGRGSVRRGVHGGRHAHAHGRVPGL